MTATLPERLQVKGERRLAVVGPPEGMDEVIGASDRRAEPDAADVILLFVRDRASFDADVPALLPRLRADAILWIAYPKLSSPLAADLNRDIIHRAAPAFGIDAVAQIAVDADWSAMRFKRV